MTKAHPHRQVNVHLDIVDDADIIERIEAQPSMVGYVRELVRRDINDERLDYVALKASELQAENATLSQQLADVTESMGHVEKRCTKLRELAAKMAEALRVSGEWCDRECITVFGCDGMDECPIAKELRELGVEVDA